MNIIKLQGDDSACLSIACQSFYKTFIIIFHIAFIESLLCKAGFYFAEVFSLKSAFHNQLNVITGLSSHLIYCLL